MKKLSVVIPCFNSEYTLKRVVDETIQVIEKIEIYDFEIILVNDGSKDNTFAIISSLCNYSNRIIGINLSQNFGQHSAMMAGHSISSGNIIVHSDDDGQTPIDELPKLLDKLDEGYDMVCAKYDIKQNSYFQNIGTKINKLMAYYLIGKPKHVHFSNLWICKSFIVKEAIKCKNPYPYLAGIYLGVTKNIAMVPATHRKRLVGKTTYSLKKMISLWLNGFTAFSITPLRIASLLGFIIAIIGFIYMIVLIINKIQNPIIPVGYSSVMSTIIFIGGMIMMMLGMIGEYIGRIYININNKPQFVIKEVVNCDRI
jgi:polyisoprenyl-phosphate glycosyltransferase